MQPETGRTLWYILPTVNTKAFERVLYSFANAVGACADKRVLLVLDGAGWHVSRDLVVPAGLELVLLPPYSPELQPAEHLWCLSDELLFNRCFTTLDELQHTLAEQCVRLMTQPQRVKDHTLFHWWPRLCQ